MYVSTHANLLNAKAQFMPKWKSATSIKENYLAPSLKLTFSIEKINFISFLFNHLVPPILTLLDDQ